MNGEDLGTRLLKEVEVVSGDEANIQEILKFLRNLQHGSSPDELGFPEIDCLLRPARPSTADHAAGSPGQRIKSTDTNSGLQSQRPSQTIIELTSLSSGAGKTNLLYLITSLNVLPRTHGETDLSGRNRAVIVIDADGRFDVERLAHVMRTLIRSAGHKAASDEFKETPPPDGPQVDLGDSDELVHRALRQVHVFRPQSLESMVATVYHIESYLSRISAHFSADRELGACILDSVSTFYWHHRAEEESDHLHKVENIGLGASEKTPPRLYRQLLQAVRQVQDRFDCAVIYTTQSVPISKDQNIPQNRSFNHVPTGTGTGLRTLLPPQWSGVSTLRLLLERATVTRFAPSMGAEEAWAEREMRWNVVKKGSFLARLLTSDGSLKRGFAFFIDDDGIHVRSDDQQAPARPSS